MAEKTTASPPRQRRSQPTPAGAREKKPATAPASTHPKHTMPLIVPEVHVRRVPLPRVDTMHVPVPRVHVGVPEGIRKRVPEPTTNRLVWYGGLTGLAAFGVITWPVAGVAAAVTVVAERRARDAAREELAKASASEGRENEAAAP